MPPEAEKGSPSELGPPPEGASGGQQWINRGLNDLRDSIVKLELALTVQGQRLESMTQLMSQRLESIEKTVSQRLDATDKTIAQRADATEKLFDHRLTATNDKVTKVDGDVEKLQTMVDPIRKRIVWATTILTIVIGVASVVFYGAVNLAVGVIRDKAAAPANPPAAGAPPSSAPNPPSTAPPNPPATR